MVKILLKDHSNLFELSVSSTTRKPRIGEINGYHYNFREFQDMDNDIKEGKFIEYAKVHGNLYGTSFDAVKKIIDHQKYPILEIDYQGVMNVIKKNMNPLTLFIMPPSFEILEQRLRSRKTETEESIIERLKNAKKEIEFGNTSKSVDDILINDDLLICYAEMKEIINKKLVKL